MPNYFKQLVKNEKGQGLVEYALILVLIAVVVIAAVTTIGTRTKTVMSTVGSSLVTPQ
jgi:pilus assembly protein Flp/PilA